MKTILYSTFYYLLLLLIINIIKPSYQQNTTATTPTDDNSDDDDSCAFISGQNCDNNGVCKACVMCLQSSCILSKSIHSLKAPSNTPVCNTTLFGDTDIYDWYGYCLSSGLDNSGDNCTASTQCYPYQRNNISTSFIWQSLTCEPNSCSLITDNGQPPPLPTALPSPNDDNNSNNGNGNGNGDTAGDANNSIHDNRYRHRMENRAITIALSVTCTLIFVATMAWLFRRWKKLQYWPMAFKKKQEPSSSPSSSSSSPNLPEGVSSSLPTTAPPSFRSTVSSSSRPPEMRQRRHSTPSLISTSSIERTDPLPSYFSPDPSLPKYEQAIVTQIRGLLFDDRHYHAIASSSSSSSNTSLPATMDHAQQQQYMDDETNMMMDHHTNALPPPMWVPVYFTPNHSFSVGRMRRHPQYYPFHHAHPPSALSESNNNEQDLGTSHHEHSS